MTKIDFDMTAPKAMQNYHIAAPRIETDSNPVASQENPVSHLTYSPLPAGCYFVPSTDWLLVDSC